MVMTLQLGRMTVHLFFMLHLSKTTSNDSFAIGLPLRADVT
jgi:hypothetical protein